MDIQPGSQVTVEITATPRTPAAEKTIERVCRKDPVIKKKHRRLKELRPSWQEKRRGGRWWHHQMKRGRFVHLTPGNQYDVLATLDVIRDLDSVADYVKVTPK